MCKRPLNCLGIALTRYGVSAPVINNCRTRVCGAIVIDFNSRVCAKRVA